MQLYRDIVGAIALVVLILSLLTATHAWNCKEVKNIKNLMQIDAGQGHVVATDTNEIPYYLQRGFIQDEWIRIPGFVKHITVGPAGTWCVDRTDRIFKYLEGKWVHAEGFLKQVDAGGDQFIVGANMQNVPFCLKSSAAIGYKGPGSPLPWKQFPGSVKYYSCGPFGCWAVNKDESIIFMNLDRDCQYSGWSNIDGMLSMIEVATDGSVFGVNSVGDIYTRDGITAKKPKGTRWSHIPQKTAMKHVSFDQGRLWAISKSGITFSCTR
uniref:Fish-egg lectin n=1 Tax=Esox lucius TaxID=8010 RepID=A0A3P8XKK4_ESOLU